MDETKAAVLQEISKHTAEIAHRRDIDHPEQFAELFVEEAEFELRTGQTTRVDVSGKYNLKIAQRLVLDALQTGLSETGSKLSAHALLYALQKSHLPKQWWFIIDGNAKSLSKQLPANDDIATQVEAKKFNPGDHKGFLVEWHGVCFFLETNPVNEVRHIFMACKNYDGIELIKVECRFDGDSILLENKDDTARIFYDAIELPTIPASDSASIAFSKSVDHLVWIFKGPGFDQKFDPTGETAAEL